MSNSHSKTTNEIQEGLLELFCIRESIMLLHFFFKLSLTLPNKKYTNTGIWEPPVECPFIVLLYQISSHSGKTISDCLDTPHHSINPCLVVAKLTQYMLQKSHSNWSYALNISIFRPATSFPPCVLLLI